MSHRLQVLIPESLEARLKKAAERERLSKGEWVRRAIEQALAQLPRKGDVLARLEGLDAPTADIEEMLGEIEAGRG
jgi:hypothetical protein